MVPSSDQINAALSRCGSSGQNVDSSMCGVKKVMLVILFIAFLAPFAYLILA